jgi:gamma-glutamylcyclotransferase (GGCT)/AIG2-like uncharacterized protein YtfP
MAGARLFVYGTLMKGEANAHLLEDARYLGPATTEPTFSLLDLGDYPALRAGGEQAVAGELYEVGAAMLEALDDCEGHPTLYRRTPIRLADGSAVEAYLLVSSDVEDPPLVASGDWRRHARR